MDGLTTRNVAKLAEVHIETLRYYEPRGLFPDRLARYPTIVAIPRTPSAECAS